MTPEEWLEHLRTAFEDSDAAAEDMLRSPRKQGLGPWQHRKLYRGGAKQMRALLDAPPWAAPPVVPEPDNGDLTPLARAAISTSFADRRLLPPGERAQTKLLYYLHYGFRYALPHGVRGQHGEEVASIVPDIVEAAVAEVRAQLRADLMARPSSL